MLGSSKVYVVEYHVVGTALPLIGIGACSAGR